MPLTSLSEPLPRLFDQIFQQQSDLTCRFRGDGTVLAVNEAFCTFFGQPAAAFVGHVWQPLVVADDVARVQRELALLSPDSPAVTIENRVVTPGGVRWGRFVNVGSFGADGTLLEIHVVGRDVTERKMLETRLDNALAELQDLYDRAPCGYHSLAPDGTFLRANGTELAWLGRSREEVVGRLGIRDVLTPESRDTFDRSFPQFLRDGEIHDVELDLVHVDGTTRRISVSATAIRREDGTIGATRSAAFDISELARTRRERAVLLAQQAAVLNTGLVGICRAVRRQIVWANSAAEQIYGVEPGGMVGRSVRFVFPTEKAFDDSGVEVADALARHGVYRGQIEHVRSDGTPLWVDLHVAALPHSDEVVAFIVDMTQMRRANEELRRAETLASAGRLAAGVAHDSNNKLAIVMGAADIALQEAPPDSALYEALSEIRTAAAKSAELNQQLLGFAQKQMATPRLVDWNRVVAAPGSSRRVPSTVTVTSNLAADLWAVRMDPEQATQVLAQIVSNACDAMPGGGRLSISTSNVAMTSPASADGAAGSSRDYVRVVVEDTGHGMSAETRSHAFEPFYTTHEFGRNRGLGLAMVHGVVTQNHGWVELTSEEGVGTRVALHFPRAADTHEPENAASAGGVGTSILLVDEDAGTRRLARSILTRHGYDVVAAASVAEAMTAATASHASIDLVLLDAHVGPQASRTIVRALARTRPTLRVLITGSDDATMRAAVDDTQATATLLRKPYGVKDLLASVDAALGQR